MSKELFGDVKMYNCYFYVNIRVGKKIIIANLLPEDANNN